MQAHGKAKAGNENTGPSDERIDPVVLARIARIFRTAWESADAETRARAIEAVAARADRAA